MEYDLQGLAECLAKGADPSYWQYPDDQETSGLMQPTTPLRMVMFRISDNDLTDEGLRTYAAIAKLLVEHGADARPAMDYAERRYGQYDPNAEPDLFMNVWHEVAKGAPGHRSQMGNKLR